MATKLRFTALLALFASASIFTVLSQQQITGKIENATTDKPSADIVLFMFGMDDPVKVGSVDDKGNITISFPGELPNNVSDETKEMFETPIIHALYFSCMDRDSFGADINEATAYKGGYFSLANAEEPWVGSLLPLSDESLHAWSEDPHYNNPVASASFYEVIYSNHDIHLTSTCNEELMYGENQVPVEYLYDIAIQKGFNIIEYKIESVFASNSPDFSDVPSVVRITNLKDDSAIKWFAKYFY